MKWLHLGHPVRAAALTARDPDKQRGPDWRKARKVMNDPSRRG